MAETSPDAALRAVVEQAAVTLEGAVFRLPFADAEWRAYQLTELATSMRRFLLPRLMDPGAPVVAVLVGLSGTGRSTVLNSLAGKRVAATGPLRPTTTTPVVWAHRRHAGRYWSEFVARVKQNIDPDMELVVDDDPLVAHLTLIDAPTIDFTTPDGVRRLVELLALSDLCIVVTSPGRYADRESWELMRVARRRGVPILHVLNRQSRDPEAAPAVAGDYASRLAGEGLLSRPDPRLLFSIHEQRVDAGTGGAPASAVAALRKELLELANPAFRDRLQRLGRDTLTDQLAMRSRAVADLMEDEVAVAEELSAMVAAAYHRQYTEVAFEIEQGLLGGPSPEVLADRLVGRAGLAAQEAAASWSRVEAGKRLLEGDNAGLWRAGPATGPDATAGVARWLAELDAMLRQQAGVPWLPWRRRRLVAAVAAAATGAPGAEGLADRLGTGTGEVLATARTGLAETARAVLAGDAARFDAALDGVASLADVAAELRAAATALVEAAGARR